MQFDHKLEPKNGICRVKENIT